MGLTDALLLDPYPFEIWIAQRSGQKGTGTLNDPFDGSTADKFDARMKELPGPTLVHLGPGTFETNGYSDDLADPWQIRAGMRIVGSGMNATILKLVNATTANAQYFAIGHRLTTGSPAVPNPMDLCEVSDLTIDANLQSGSSVACGAVRLMGNHVKVQRVRAKNWGTTSSTKPCFVIAVLTADRSSAGMFEAVNAGIDRCVADQPAPYGSAVAAYLSAPAITVLHVGGKESAADNAEAYGRACYIRNSFVDCGSLANPLTPDIRGLSMGWCRAGVVEGNQAHNIRIGGPYQDKATSREITVRNNSYRNVRRGPWWKLGLNGSVGTRSISLTKVSSSPPTAEATLSGHDFLEGDRVKIDGTISAGNENAVAYKGVFVILSVPASDKFRYVMTPDDPGTHILTVGSITARKVFGVANILVERNIIEFATGASTAETGIHMDDGKTDGDTTVDTPDYAHTEAVVRENRIRYVDVKFDSSWSGEGVRVSGVKNVIVRDSVIEIAPANPIKNFRCGTVKYFNNKTPSGALIQGLNGITTQKYSELETESEDALLMTLM